MFLVLNWKLQQYFCNIVFFFLTLISIIFMCVLTIWKQYFFSEFMKCFCSYCWNKTNTALILISLFLHLERNHFKCNFILFVLFGWHQFFSIFDVLFIILELQEYFCNFDIFVLILWMAMTLLWLIILLRLRITLILL